MTCPAIAVSSASPTNSSDGLDVVRPEAGGTLVGIASRIRARNIFPLLANSDMHGAMTPPAAELKDVECVFCNIVARDPSNQIFYADEDVVAFLDIAPATKGHTLIVPRVHAADIFDVREDQFGAAARSALRVAKRLEQRLHPDGLTIIQSNRAAGWQDVFHLHFHLVPRYAGDGLVRPWVPGEPCAEDMRALMDTLG